MRARVFVVDSRKLFVNNVARVYTAVVYAGLRGAAGGRTAIVRNAAFPTVLGNDGRTPFIVDSYRERTLHARGDEGCVLREKKIIRSIDTTKCNFIQNPHVYNTTCAAKHWASARKCSKIKSNRTGTPTENARAGRGRDDCTLPRRDRYGGGGGGG